MPHQVLPRPFFLFLLTMCCLALIEESDSSTNNYYFSSFSRPQVSPQELREKRALAHKPGFFRTLFSVVYEQWVDTKNTVTKVNKLINDNFLPENAPPVTEPPPNENGSNVTTTPAPFKITRTEFNRILNRNLRGLVRLFNIELQDALKQSEETKQNKHTQLRKTARL